MPTDTDESLLYEIVEFPDGEIGLCRAGEGRAEDEPLVTIRFSEESRYFLEQALQNGALSVAKAMIDAGLDAVQELQAEVEVEQDAQPVSHLIH